MLSCHFVDIIIFSHIDWLYSFILYKILIGKYTFCLNSAHKQLCTRSGSWDTTFGLFSHMAKCVLYIFSNIGWFYTYILYKTLIGKYKIWWNWTRKQLYMIEHLMRYGILAYSAILSQIQPYLVNIFLSFLGGKALLGALL